MYGHKYGSFLLCVFVKKYRMVWLLDHEYDKEHRASTILYMHISEFMARNGIDVL
jgi:hypothetical protein